MAKKHILSKKEIGEVLDFLASAYPEAECALNHRSNWELLVAVVLSAQTTDVSVNMVAPELFARWPDAAALAVANTAEVEDVIHNIGMYRTKSKNIVRLAQKLIDDLGGEVPQDFDKLLSLPGVGRKTANVVLSVGFGEQHIAVDTHVFRVSNRIGLCHENDVLKTELALMKAIPESRWTQTHHCLIWHGRKVCNARKPACDDCVLNEICLHVKDL